MSAMDLSGIECALALHRAPHLSADVRNQPLPDGMLWVVRCAAGDSQTLEELAGKYAESAATLTEACGFFVQQAMFAPEADAYRVLGTRPGDESSVIREHHRWLIRWLHPDRIGEDWLSVFADRVNHAWHQLRNPERRRQYDQDRAAGLPPHPGFVPPPRAPRISGRHAVFRGTSPASNRGRWAAAAAIVLGVAAIGFAWRHADGPPSLSDTPLGLDEHPDFTPSYMREIRERRSTARNAPVADPPDEPVGSAPRRSAPNARDTSAPVARTEIASLMEPPSLPRSEPLAAERIGTSGGRIDAAPAENASTDVPDTAPLAAPETRSAQRSAPSVDASSAHAGERRAAVAVPPVAAPGPGAETPVVRTPVATAEPEPEPEALDREKVLDFLGHFQVAYERGELREFMDLFTSDARNNRGGREAIREDYDLLFATTRSRSILFENLDWRGDGQRGELRARFLARVETERSRRASESRGDIRFGVVLIDGEPRIESVLHNVRSNP